MTKKAKDYSFDLSELDAVDESHMTVLANGKLTNWVWVFAGPGHPRTIEQSNRMARERLEIERQQEQARVNGRKWKAPEETVDGVRTRNVRLVSERLIGWHLVDAKGLKLEQPVTMAGQPFPYSPENATTLLTDPRKGALLVQALEFLADETAFTKRSESN